MIRGAARPILVRECPLIAQSRNDLMFFASVALVGREFG